jgi:hypothetical protein
MRARRLKPADLVEYGGEDQRAGIPEERRRRAFGVERTWELMASLGVRHRDLENAFPREFCASAVSADDIRARIRSSKTQVIDFIKEPLPAGEANSSMISMGAKVGVPDFGVSNADPPEVAAERMKAWFAAMDTT